MRIAYFTNTYPRATDTFIRREVLGLRERGFEVFTFSVRKTGADHDVEDEVIQEKKNTHYLLPCSPIQLMATHAKALFKQPLNYIKTLYLALLTSRPGVKGHILQIVYFIEAILLSDLIKKNNIQHLHNHLGDNSGTVTLLAAKYTNITYSISIHGPHIFFDGLHWALDVKTANSTFIACIGHYCKSQMMLYTHQKDWHKFKIIRCGIDPQQFHYQEPDKSIKKLVYVGRLSGEKGVPILFESLKTLKAKGYSFELNLLGDGDDRKNLERSAQQYGINENVHFHGFVDRTTIETTLIASDIFILPSFAEGIPVALMEAMAIGIPVITTYVGGIAELVIDNTTGKMVYPSDPEGLAEAIAYYINNPDKYREISKNAREKVITEFNINDQIDKLADLLKQSIQEKNT